MFVPLWLWIATVGGLLALIALDLVIVDRKPHEVTTAEAARWVIFYISCAVVFGIGVWIFAGQSFGVEFFTGYITEYSLSVDNLFIFMIIMASFKVPAIHQHRVLLVGILLALAMRSVFNGKRMITPMLVVIVAIGSADLLFAVDSIPAIFGITQESFLVFTANAFALMGLRQLYFLLGGLVTKLVYLSYGLAVILGFIGAKLFLHALHEYHVVPDWLDVNNWISLGVIVVVLTVTTLASLAKARKDERAQLTAG